MIGKEVFEWTDNEVIMSSSVVRTKSKIFHEYAYVH